MMGLGMNMGRGKFAAGGGGVSRADVLALTPSLLFDFTDNSLMYQDEAKTTLVSAANDPVAWVEDLGSAGEDLAILAGQTATRPMRSANGIIFDGINDSLLNASFASLSLTYPFTVCVAFKFMSLASNDYVYSGGDGGGFYPSINIYNVSGTITFLGDPPGSPYWRTQAADLNNHIISMRPNTGAGAAQIQFDGDDQGAIDCYSSRTLDALYLGRAGGSPTAYNGNVEIQKFAAFDGKLADGDLATVEAWMNDQGVL